VAKLTHIVANTIDFPQFFEAQAVLVPVVTNSWITASVKKRKPAPVRPFSPDPRMIFSEIVLTCVGLPEVDQESITGAVMALGGMESREITRLTTHICSLTMDDPKVVAAMERGGRAKVVLPHWFDDCFKLGKRIDEGPYLLPDPEIIRLGVHDDIDFPSEKHLDGAVAAQPNYIPSQRPGPAESRQPITIFNRKTVMLSADLNLSLRLRTILVNIIKSSNGTLVTDVEQCDMFICQYRSGPGYVRAAQAGKDVGSLAWLYHLITRDEWTSPFRRLLHYPVPKEPIPGFQDLRITVSNYGGEARIYLENLVRAAGGTFTKTMNTQNTHLITARNNSEKCEAAEEWNVLMVNHLWLEESYAKAEMQAVTVGKYTHFPPRTNLGEIIGQTFLNEARLRERYYPGGEESMSSAAKRKRKILDAAQENTHDFGPAEGVVRTGRRPPKEFDVMKDGYDSKNKAGARSSVKESFATPARATRGRLGKENETPSALSTGSRSAKNKALTTLQKIAPDVALYEKEKKRSSKDSHAPWGGKRAADHLDKERAARKSSPLTAKEDDDEEKERPAKKQRHSLPQVEMRVLITGYTRWTGQPLQKEEAEKVRSIESQFPVNANGLAEKIAQPWYPNSR
jgi:hypothetical protein